MRVGNLALVPGGLLARKAQWRAVANSLPQGSVLVILPRRESGARRAAESVITHLQADGHRVTILPVEQFAEGPLHSSAG